MGFDLGVGFNLEWIGLSTERPPSGRPDQGNGPCVQEPVFPNSVRGHVNHPEPGGSKDVAQLVVGDQVNVIVYRRLPMLVHRLGCQREEAGPEVAPS
jgi:hypothetical protein